jgi:hypothetical protein
MMRARLIKLALKPQVKPYRNFLLAPNPSFVSRRTLRRCICADRQSDKNVSRETLLSDLPIIPVKTDRSPISASKGAAAAVSPSLALIGLLN